MSLIRINRQPTRSQLRVFALAWALAFGCFAFSAWGEELPILASTLAAFAFGVPAVGLSWPAMLRFAYLGLTYLTFPLGWLFSHVILALIYYLVLTPTGWLLRLFRYDPLARRWDRDATSYWKARDESPTTESYFRQH